MLSLVLLSFMQSNHAQFDSTSDLYSAAIDTVINTLPPSELDRPSLVFADQFYAKNIKTYKGKHAISYSTSFSAAAQVQTKGSAIYLDVMPITVSKGEIIIIVKQGSVEFKSRNRWKLDNENVNFHYVFFQFNEALKSYLISDVHHGIICPDTVN